VVTKVLNVLYSSTCEKSITNETFGYIAHLLVILAFWIVKAYFQ
jgi:hypothetical protein